MTLKGIPTPNPILDPVLKPPGEGVCAALLSGVVAAEVVPASVVSGVVEFVEDEALADDEEDEEEVTLLASPVMLK